MAPLALAVTLWLDPHFREEQRAGCGLDSPLCGDTPACVQAEREVDLADQPLGCAAFSWASSKAWQDMIFSPAEHLIQGVCDP